MHEFPPDLDNPWIDIAETEDEISLSTGNHSLGEFDYSSLEEFINLGAMITESNMNSFNTDPTTDHLASEPNQGNIGISEHSAAIDATVVSNEILRRPTSIPEDFVENNVSGISVNHSFFEVLETSFSSKTRFEPSVFSRDDPTSTLVLSLSDSPNGVVPEMPQPLLESPVGTNVKPNSRKRQLEEGSSPVSAEGIVSVSNNINGQSCTCTGEETPRGGGPSKKLRLFDQEKDLEKENKELNAKVKELSASVEFLRNCIVSKLKGQCYFCKK